MIFVSHSEKDRPFVSAFVSFLRNGMEIPSTQIFCSSIPGHDIPAGKNSIEFIRETFNESTLVIALITQNFNSSPFCWCEMGGAWIVAKEVVPMIVPPLDFKDLEAVLGRLQAKKFDEHDLESLYEAVLSVTKIKRVPGSIWLEGKRDFLAAMPKAISAIEYRGSVSRDEHAQALCSLKEFKEEYKKKSEQLDSLDKAYQLLLLGKADEAAAVLATNSSDVERFENLTKQCRIFVQRLPRLVQKVMCLKSAGLEYSGNGEFGEYQELEHQGYVKIDSESGVIRLDLGEGRVSEAWDAICQLQEWMDGPQSCKS